MIMDKEKFITTQSKNCFYGNVANVLNNDGVKISEAELILISETLNCPYLFSENGLFFGIHSEVCTVGLSKIGYGIKTIVGAENVYTYFEQKKPIILSINSKLLTHNNIYFGTDRIHHIIVVEKTNGQLLISDSFVPTIPSTVYQGLVDCEKIYREIDNGNAKGILIYSDNNLLVDITKLCKDALSYYIISNTKCENGSVIQSLNKYSQLALTHQAQYFANGFLKEMIYDLRFSGAIARFDYLIELFNRYLPNLSSVCASLEELKSKWELVVNKLVKCSITLKEDYYRNIFQTDVPLLLEKEKDIYERVGGTL